MLTEAEIKKEPMEEDKGIKFETKPPKIRRLVTEIHQPKYKRRKIFASDSSINEKPRKTKKSCCCTRIFGGCLALVSLLPVVAALLIWKFPKYSLTFGQANCNDSINVGHIMASLRSSIYSQEASLKELDRILRDHNGLTTVALIGGVGTGKTLTSTILASAYPREDTHFYVWDNFRPNLTNSIKLNQLVSSFPECKQQLLVVDNLLPDNRIFVDDFTRMLFTGRRMQLIVIYLFTLETYSKEGRELYEVRKSDLMKMSHMNVISYRSFDETDLEGFLNFLPGQQNHPTTPQECLQLAANLNVKTFGFKKIFGRLKL